VIEQLTKLLEFHRTFGAHIETEPAAEIPDDVIAIRVKLLQEELDEYKAAARERDLIGVSDALTDLLYVLLGTYVSHGLQDYAEELFDEVHRSNMSKLDENDLPILRDDGKVLKSPRFVEPDLEGVLSQPRQAQKSERHTD
jgi:predicted HAD superfamily Cof-like phosphohydrolase